jgi:hypothetical protein
MVSGRLREHDRDQIAMDMIEWALLEDSTNLNGFCGKKFIAPSKLSQWAKEEAFFRQSLDITKAIIADRREKMLSSGLLHVKGYDLSARAYDYFIREDHVEMLRLQIKLKQEEDKQVSEEINKGMDAILNQISSLQDSSKTDLSKTSNE